jgi:hypothetical protein
MAISRYLGSVCSTSEVARRLSAGVLLRCKPERCSKSAHSLLNHPFPTLSFFFERGSETQRFAVGTSCDRFGAVLENIQRRSRWAASLWGRSPFAVPQPSAKPL